MSDHKTHEAIDDDGGYTRIKNKTQIGDGPDARAEVTVELVRGVDHDEHETLFAEYVLESDRAIDHARNTLGIEGSEEEGDR